MERHKTSSEKAIQIARHQMHYEELVKISSIRNQSERILKLEQKKQGI